MGFCYVQKFKSEFTSERVGCLAVTILAFLLSIVPINYYYSYMPDEYVRSGDLFPTA